MPTEIFLPRLTQTMDEGRVADWMKREGEAVRQGEPLLAVESDKSTVELEAPASGVLARIDRGAGEMVAIGATLGWILAAGETTDSLPARGDGPVQAADQIPSPAASPRPPASAGAAPSTGGLQATPVARRLAAEHGIDLASIKASGPDGRVSKEDVLAVLAQRGVKP
ncbi:MAG: E3 binding domain-containing protein [Alphaproteobacteria bacterium]